MMRIDTAGLRLWSCKGCDAHPCCRADDDCTDACEDEGPRLARAAGLRETLDRVKTGQPGRQGIERADRQADGR